MPRKDGSFTRGEVAFIAAYAEHGDRVRAEKSAGLAPRSGYDILERPEVLAKIRARQLARLTSDALPIAVATVIEVMQSAKSPAAARVQAAKVVLDRALPQGEGAQMKELHEMSPEEIGQAIATLEAQAASMARPVGELDSPDIFD